MPGSIAETLAALAPVFVLILVGHQLRRRDWIGAAFWSPAERLVYFLFFPALLFRNTATADLGGLDVGGMGVVSVLGVLVVGAALVLARRRLTCDGPAFTSVFQAAIRPNVYVGMGAAVALLGDWGLSLIAVCIAVNIPLVNFLSVLILARHAAPAGSGRQWRRSARIVITNPIILACLLGGGLNLGGVAIPGIVDPLLDILGRPALPLALMAVGAGLDFTAARRAGALVAGSLALKMLALPALTLGAGLALGLPGAPLFICVLFAALPTSVSSYVLARQMGGDGPLLAGIITAGTLFSVITLPLLLVLYQLGGKLWGQ